MRDHKGEGEMPLLAKDDTLVLELYPLGSKGTLLDVEPADHFENTDKYQRWMFHTSKRDPREIELTKMMQRAERLVHHPNHTEDKSQSKECQEMGKLLNALRTRRREWEVFRTSPRPFTQMLCTLTEAVCAMELAMGITIAPSTPEPDPEAWLQAA